MKKRMYPHELVGQIINIVAATNKTLVGLQGKVVDETKFTIKIEVNGSFKTVLKKGISFALSNGEIVEGNTIIKRSEDRLKG
ncbi:ribonuclease P protein subunit [Candidatus Woesearchaeota archaeon]|jgi:ribonuclease P protein subunit POP4|nr:ribonuclease P protein subunit [Candidatus Woesearchaeota archaeon]MBT5739565.1 ribonuclease P protein subunit [Candidatus Woesearchaeota archaeon]